MLVPSGAGDSVAVEVVAGIGRDACDLHASDLRGCVVAKRLLKYIPHDRLTVPIALEAACAGIDCGDRTCVAGECVDPGIDPGECPGGVCPTPKADAAPPPVNSTPARARAGSSRTPRRTRTTAASASRSTRRPSASRATRDDCKAAGKKCCAIPDGIAGTDTACQDKCLAGEVEVCSSSCDCSGCKATTCGVATCDGTCPGG